MNTTPRPYASVEAVIIRWKSGDLATHIRDELELLRHEFREFRFGCRDIEIGKEDPQRSLQQALNHWYRSIIRNKQPALAIVVYGGHGGGEQDSLWFYNNPKGDRSLNWSQIQADVVCGDTGQQVDQLIVLDCCEAGRALQPALPRPSHSLDFFLASNHQSTGSGMYSFTRTFTATLETLEHTNFTIETLRQALHLNEQNRIADAAYYLEREAGGLKHGQDSAHHKRHRRRLEAEQEIPPNIFTDGRMAAQDPQGVFYIQG